jgi:hypothetical protein
MAFGVLTIASKDFLLELGHALCHTNEYLSGEVKVHSHMYGHKIVVHHDHATLKKIEKTLENLQEGDTEDFSHDTKLLKVDPIKIISQGNKKLSGTYGIFYSEYHYSLQFDQDFYILTTPPPRFLTA